MSAYNAGTMLFKACIWEWRLFDEK